MNLDNTAFKARPSNWLPIPGVAFDEKMPTVEEDDMFPKGEVVQFYPRQGCGSIKNKHGGVIPFRLKEIELVGPKGDARYLSIGCRVGFDASHTSGGPLVTKIKIY